MQLLHLPTFHLSRKAQPARSKEPSSLGNAAVSSTYTAGAAMTASVEERRDRLRTLIAAVAAVQPAVSQEDVLLLDDQELEVLVQKKLTTTTVLRSTTYNKLIEAGVAPGAAEVLKLLFPAGTSLARGGEGQGSGAGTTGLAGSEPITITIYDRYQTPCIYDVTFRNAQRFDKFLDRGQITSLFKDGQPSPIDEFSDLVPGATYTTALCSIPEQVLEQHKEHLVRRREQEFTCAILDDLASKGVQAVELPEQRVVKAGGPDEAEVDVVISHTVPGCVGAVSFVGGAGREGAACFVRRGFVIGSTKSHVSGDSDARNLGKKIQRQYAQRPPFAGHPIQPAFMPENVKSGQRTRLEDTCREQGVWLYARNGRSISRVQLQAAACARLALV